MMTSLMQPTRAQLWMLSKWALMAAAVFWIVVFRLSQQTVKLPEFVYVNF
jgi:hypothetical protein